MSKSKVRLYFLIPVPRDNLQFGTAGEAFGPTVWLQTLDEDTLPWSRKQAEVSCITRVENQRAEDEPW